jgi:hypothetical protein
MQNPAWIALLRRIPVAQQNTLVIVTTVGTEITVQSVLRLEDDYLVIRGRLSGTTDTGRVFFIPYDQMNYLGFQKEVKEAEIRALYGEPEPVATVAPKTETPDEPPPEEATVAPTIPEPSPPQPVPAEARLSIPRKSGILARLRARRDGANGVPPPRP